MNNNEIMEQIKDMKIQALTGYITNFEKAISELNQISPMQLHSLGITSKQQQIDEINKHIKIIKAVINDDILRQELSMDMPNVSNVMDIDDLKAQLEGDML